MLVVRGETREDEAAIRRVLEAAFGSPSEADLVNALRCSGSLSISLVAFKNAALVGHIAFSPIAIETTTRTTTGLGLAPLAVLPEFQQQGIGSALVRRGLEECTRAGHHAVVVVGDPVFYHRFGFKAASSYGLRCTFAVPPEAFMVAEICPGALKECAGLVRYRPEFESV